MLYKIAICDDSADTRLYVESLVRRWGRQTDHDIQIMSFPSAESFLFHYEDDHSMDIILLDIEMAGMDGLSLARELRKSNDLVQIVFVTGYSEYIEEGYDVSALHYLVKPLKKEKLFSVLDRAVGKLHKNEQVLTLEAGSEVQRIPVYQIVSVGVRRNYVTIHAAHDYTVKMTLSQVARNLDDRFYRVGRSDIVNLTKILRVTTTDIYLDDGTTIPLPRGAYEGVNRAIIGLGK
ncbi:two-component response regulator [Scardovia inopinata]|uniref:Response regulatory domain-containing protein n=1 Tax=Scardovia inopinata F0304 TaxID=641146 RepID=W5IIK6_SCAIO|nr:LytTR family DNA-binding domain-containing protein [Scardovia inopinata]EFG26856.1 hypothetical protein HMPREF9020_00485 [Scardovia inopinata F0304]BAR06462.1 putative two-component response regulator [Scardovia inopinata JCM 12537]SUV51978.1 two-component response regulator [Scardovia inopinata]